MTNVNGDFRSATTTGTYTPQAAGQTTRPLYAIRNDDEQVGAVVDETLGVSAED